ncbi:MAG TPA: DUF3574 domain-containing protein [Acetobacteraceae bacterium]|nr:DUF3574 domain-containing protein [Acetobacteraceae bacterium]
MTAYVLFFGRSIGNRAEVGNRDWNEFLDHVVTPNLSSGYTVFDGSGAWLDPATQRTLQERTKVLLAVLPDTSASAAAVARIRQNYRIRFHQNSVGMTTMPACGAF